MENPISKRRRLEEEQESNWSDLLPDILRNVIGRLRWVDRIRSQAVCKGWLIPTDDIPVAAGEVPYAMKFDFKPSYENVQIKYNMKCRILDPLGTVNSVSVREEFAKLILDSKPCGSRQGWVLFKEFDHYNQAVKSFFLYSPFTSEVIKLPSLVDSPASFQVITFSLDATSPKCVIFLLWATRRKIYVRLCSAGDKSWKIFEFNGFEGVNHAVDATYLNGCFYCVFQYGQMGVFNVDRQEWTIVDDVLPTDDLVYGKLIASGSNLLLLRNYDLYELQLLRFDFSNMRWVYENNLNNQVLFLGGVSFSIPAIGEASRLSNTIFSCCLPRPSVRFYGGASPGPSRLYNNYVKATKDKMSWIQLPCDVTWRADDLIRAV